MIDRSKLQPCIIDGVEFDALIDESKTLSASIPTYPVEDGFPVSDNIVLDPVSLQMTLYVSNTPVTWLYRHGTSMDRVNNICNQIEDLWLEKKLVKVVTSDAIYTDMGILSIGIKKSKELSYAREISISLQKVRITKRETVNIPAYVLKSGESNANAGVATTSTTSNKSGTVTGTSGSQSTGSTASSSPGSSSSSSSSSDAKKKQSILYGAAKGLGIL
jgi:hypothetical protein